MPSIFIDDCADVQARHVMLPAPPTLQHCRPLLAPGIESIYTLKECIFFSTYTSETLHNPVTETLQPSQQYALAVHNPNNQFGFAYCQLLTMHTHCKKVTLMKIINHLNTGIFSNHPCRNPNSSALKQGKNLSS